MLIDLHIFTYPYLLFKTSQVSHKSLSQNTHTQTWLPFMKTPKSDLTHDSPKVVAVDNTP